MRSSSMAVLLLLLLLLISEARGIRLEKGLFEFAEEGSKTHTMEEEKSSSSRQSISNQYGNTATLFACKNGENCSETMKKRAPNMASKKPHFHWLPGMQEDYHGPRTHKPRHH